MRSFVSQVAGAVCLLTLMGCGNSRSEDFQPLAPSPREPIDAAVDRAKKDVADLGPTDAVPEAEVDLVILEPTSAAVLKNTSTPLLRVQAKALSLTDGGALNDPIEAVSFMLRPVGETSGSGDASGPLFGPLTNSEFSTRMDLSRAETGEHDLIVSALTRSGARAFASKRVLVDAGPRVRILSPLAGGAYKGSVVVQVQVDSEPFGPTVEPVKAVVGNTPVALSRGSTSGLYEGLLEFNAYEPPLVDEQALRVTATNSQGTQSETEVKFVVDVRGPAFSETLPREGQVAGGVITVRAKLSDAAGVLGPSVIAIIGNKADVTFTVELKPEAGSKDVYSATFDTAKLTPCKPAPDTSLCIVLPNISFRASDVLGNESFMAYDFAVDNHPPVFDLDPPPDMRLMKFDKKERRVVCSWPFDPLGDYLRLGDMPNSGCAVPQVFDLRARIEDWGNRAEGLKVEPISGIAPTTTSTYVLDDTQQPLIVDMDGDGVCDGINPKLAPTVSPPTRSDQVLTIRLIPVAPKGEGDFTKDVSLEDPIELTKYPGCSPGKDEEAPLPLCGTQSIPVAIGYPTALDPQAAVWTIEPMTEKEPWCLGGQFDTHANEIAEGWACIAAAGADRNGNAGVSAPLRVWIQKRGLLQNGPTCPVPPAEAGPAPDCTGSYDSRSGEVSTKPCVARRFPGRELRWQEVLEK